MASSGGMNWLVPIQVVLISTGVVSIALAIKASVIPLLAELSTSHLLPPIRSTLLAWLRPPILYLIINGIIITIAASSRFHKNRQEAPNPLIPDPPERVAEVEEPAAEAVAAGGDVPLEVFEDKRVVAENGGCLTIEDGCADGGDDDEVEELLDLSSMVLEADLTEILPVGGPPATKPTVSSKFIHRKSLSVISDGGREARARDCEEEHESMEATWKAITEGRDITPSPTTVMMYLSGSCDDQERQISSSDQVDNPPPPAAKFDNERNDFRQLPPFPPAPVARVKLRKEPSLSPEELNRRVEAFIEKVNEEMRLQRQESLDQLKEMMGRGI